MHPLKDTLDSFYRDYNFRERLRRDPLAIPHRYSDPEDMEVAGFVASCFAYGKVGLFMPVIEKILKPGGRRPSLFFINFSLRRDAKYLKDISYRFNREKDVLCLAYILSRLLQKYGSLKGLFYSGYASGTADMKSALNNFTGNLLGIDTSPVYGRDTRPYGLKQLFPSPAGGSACKRMNLFLRWMVRKRDIDLGIWDDIPPSSLIIPLDTHIAKISKCLGLTRRNSSNWKTADEITESLKKFDPDDPLKYDFALCHQGISGLCKGERSAAICSSCVFFQRNAKDHKTA